ncbi:MAG TPA: hypothetical protein VE954_35195 [Oligoflexus sp.]|uniref:hypothetical protein n=1 Tax=Oligoflexus sp. TaxID=1971216 RepID=UPI002D4A0544|nr:hypothetical protein [Oligoflexus sp.]HYX38379.1 hypothetical protein [Oligoflexus sp.]
MQITKNYVLGLALAMTLVACGKDEKTKTVTVENPKTAEALKSAEKEREELKGKLELAEKNDVEIEGVKEELKVATDKVTELTTSLAAKDVELTDAKTALEEAKKTTPERVKALEEKVAGLEKAKAELNEQLTTARSDKTRLDNLVEVAKRDEDLYKKTLDYAIAKGAKSTEQVGAELVKDLAKVEDTLKSLAAKEPGLKSAVSSQAQVVVQAAADFKKVSGNMLGVYAELEARVKRGETLSAADDKTYKTLKAFDEATKALDAEKKVKQGLESALDGLNKEIVTLDATLAKANTELNKFRDDLLALIATDPKLTSPEAQKLTASIKERETLIATTTKTRKEKADAVAAEGKKLEASNGKIATYAATLEQKSREYNDSAVVTANGNLTKAEAELETRVKAYRDYQKAVVDANTSKQDLSALKVFFDSKLKKPAQA